MSEPGTRSRFTWKRIVGYVISAAIVVAIFVWAIPKYADYHDVASAIGTLTPLEFWSLFAATIFNLVTYWWANQAALPGMGIGKAAVLTQTTTSVANTLPAGGAIAIGLTYSILDSWGFTGTNVALYVGVIRIGNGLARCVSWFRRLLRKPPVTGWGDGAARFRRDTIALVKYRWIRLTVFTV